MATYILNFYGLSINTGRNGNNDNEMSDSERSSTENLSVGSCYSDFDIDFLSEDDDVFLYDEIEMLAMDDCSEGNTPVPDLDRMVPEGEEEEEEYDWDSDLDVDVQVVPCSMRDLTRRVKEARRTKELGHGR
ncbi:hypothetical protein BG000_003432 [Podila horticola]|nr:hypothetical protein BG000_003432 [Podila horticola]